MDVYKIREIKRDFVLQMYLRRGLFWEGVNKVRMVQGVEAESALPPPRLSPPFAKDDVQKLQSWRLSVRVAWEQAVPRRYWWTSNWDEFTTACVLYDPPELELEQFAEYGSLTPTGTERSEGQEGGEESRVLSPAIEWIDSVGHRVNAMEEFYKGLIGELGRRHFEPHGVDVWQVVSDIYLETDLLEKLHTTMQEAETQPRIVVDKDTSDKEILHAGRTIRAMQEKNPGGRPPRDRLIAITCAALYHDHNSIDSEDERRKRWTYERLAQEIVLSSPRSGRGYKSPQRLGKAYVTLGQKLRKERDKNLGT